MTVSSGLGPRPDLRRIELDGHVVLFDPIAPAAHLLNPSAAQIWDGLVAGLDAGAIADHVVAHSDAPASTAARDVDDVIEQFRSLDLLGDARPASPAQSNLPMALSSQIPEVDAAPRPSFEAGPYLALSHAFAVHVPDQDILADTQRSLAGLPSAPAGQSEQTIYELVPNEAGLLDVLVDRRRARTGVTAEAALGFVFWHVHRQAIARSDHLVRLHAAAVETRGVLIALPAPPESGKSTLVTGLLAHGYRYATDEVVAIDPDTGEATAVALPITLDRGSWALFPDVVAAERPGDPGSRHIRAEQVRAEQPRDPAPRRLGAIVFHRYRLGQPCSVERLAPAPALVALLENAFGLADADDAAFATLVSIAEKTPCYRLDHGDLSEAIDAIDAIVDELGLV